MLLRLLIIFMMSLSTVSTSRTVEAALHYSENSEQSKAGDSEIKDQKNPLALCRDEDFQIQFLCDPDWDVQSESNTLFIILSYDPAVTMTILRTESPFLIMEQITKPVLEEWDQYSEGFKKEQVTFAGADGIVVKAFSKEYPDVRLVDYYSIHKEYLYNVLFSVNPKQEWDEYKFLIKNIKDSFEFIKEQ